MSRRMTMAGLYLLTAFNIAVLIINMSSPSKGQPATGESSKAAAPKAAPSKGAPSKAAPSKGTAAEAKYQQLLRDPDFTRAVKEIIQGCAVNVDLAKVEC